MIDATTNIVKSRGLVFGERVAPQRKNGKLGVVTKLPCTPNKGDTSMQSTEPSPPRDPRAAMLKMLASRSSAGNSVVPKADPGATLLKNIAARGVASTSSSESLPSLKAIGDTVDVEKLEKLNGNGVNTFWVIPDGANASEKENYRSTLLVLNASHVALISAEGSTGTISWLMSRNNVSSLTMSNCGPIATLLFANGTKKSFTFKSMENLFAFVQTHYQTKMTNAVQSSAVTPAMPKNASQGVSPFELAMKSLSQEEKDSVNKYRKMLKMKLPEQAVRHKMRQENFDKDNLIDLVFCDDSSGSNSQKLVNPSEEGSGGQCSGVKTNQLSTADEAALKKYRTMLKMNVPQPAVLHKMKMEGVEQRLIGVLFPEEAKEQEEAPAQAPKLSAADEAALKKYRTMLKMNVPQPGVLHKMKMEGVEQRLIEALFPEEGKSAAPPKEKVTLTASEEETAKKYRTMLKMNVPPMAVEHKMVQERVSERIIHALFPKSSPAGKKKSKLNSVLKSATKAKPDQQKKKGKRTTGDTSIALKQIHWTPLSDDALKKSVWGKVSQTKSAVGSASVDNSDIKIMEELFHKKTGIQKSATGNTGGFGSQSTKKQKRMAGLVDITRCNNIAISLKAFKEFTFDQLVETLKNLDASKKITGDRIGFLSSVLPNEIERKQIANFKGKEDELLPAEIFFKKIINVNRVQVKIRVMQTMDTFESNAADLNRRLTLIGRVCEQVREKESATFFRGMVIMIGRAKRMECVGNIFFPFPFFFSFLSFFSRQFPNFQSLGHY